MLIIYQLRWEIRTLKNAALVFLLLAVMALDAAGAEGSSAPPTMQEIDAEEIVAKIREGQPVEYDHVVVRGDLDLSWERLRRNITSPMRINDSIFDGQVSFNGSTLLWFVDLSGSNFTRDAYFIGSTFNGDADFEKIIFSRDVYFDEVTFSKSVDFWKGRFSEYAGFVKATFSGGAGFREATFNKYVLFSYATFSKFGLFRETTFSRSAYFDGATFSGDANFWRATFRIGANFFEATFSGDTYFLETSFIGGANFEGTTFSKYAEFGGAMFGEDVNIRGATFSEDASFGAATFRGDADFGGAKFNGDADFRWATFSGNANFKDATFSSDADFRKAEFIGNTTFGEAEFNGNIEFGDARFENETSFYRILFKRPAYFENCTIKSLNLTKAEYSRLHLRWGDITSLHFDEAAYLALIKNYNNLGWYGDANGCYYDYRNAVRERWMADSSTKGFAARLSNLLDWFVDFMEWLLYGYGVKPPFPIAWSVGTILAFGLFFRQKRCLRKIIVEERIEDSKEGSDEVQVKTTARKAEIGALDPILFSLFTFTSGFTAFLHPTIEYKLERCVRWAIFERLLGPFFLALVITAISKTYLIR
jgi:uncharacterized protein YjbI with pentapeptide repeats